MPRDADMQAQELGRVIDWQSGALRRGDLVFWEGHVGIMTSAKDFLHANAFHMVVVAEPFAQGEAADQGGGLSRCAALGSAGRCRQLAVKRGP